MRHSYIDEYSGIDSFLHRLEPRVKVIVFLSLILCIVLTPPDSFSAFSLYALLTIVLIILSKLPLIYVLKKSFVVFPFILMVCVFLPFLKQDGLAIMRNALIKGSLSILCMVLLMGTTGFNDLLKAMERLKFPSLIAMILAFMYRYIFVIEDEMMKMRQAKEARTVGGSKWFHAKALANMTGVLFIRSYERAEAVYLAMCSRGFDGSIKTINNSRITLKDWLFLAAMAVLLFLIWMKRQ